MARIITLGDSGGLSALSDEPTICRFEPYFPNLKAPVAQVVSICTNRFLFAGIAIRIGGSAKIAALTENVPLTPGGGGAQATWEHTFTLSDVSADVPIVDSPAVVKIRLYENSSADYVDEIDVEIAAEETGWGFVWGQSWGQ